MKKRYLLCIVTILVIIFNVSVFNYAANVLPGNIYITPEKAVSVDFNIPLSLTDTATEQKSNVSIKQTFVPDGIGDYKFQCKLFGIIPVKEMNVKVTNREVVTPVGVTVGLYLHTDGVLVLNQADIIDSRGQSSCPSEGKIQSGDYIIGFNNEIVSDKSKLTKLLNFNKSKTAKIVIVRNGVEKTAEIKPVKDKNGDYKIGLWVRDDTQGLGTITYVDENNKFGALGHNVSDIDTGESLQASSGKIYKAKVWGIKKGESGNPGSICGTINYNNDNVLGKIYDNCKVGLYGEITNPNLINIEDFSKMEVGYKQEIKKGKAQILFYMDGHAQLYDINITKIKNSDKEKEKSMVIEITDEELINKTGGIVQGMSGAPIIQNNKIIGAVTHVMVDEPTEGYGIFIENMLEH